MPALESQSVSSSGSEQAEAQQKGSELDESELRLAQLQHQLPSNEPGALMHLMENASGEEEDDEETRECKALFKNTKFFLSREVGLILLVFVYCKSQHRVVTFIYHVLYFSEDCFCFQVPRESMLFVIPAFGGVVSWEGEGAPFDESDQSITHQVCHCGCKLGMCSLHKFLSRIGTTMLLLQRCYSFGPGKAVF